MTRALITQILRENRLLMVATLLLLLLCGATWYLVLHQATHLRDLHAGWTNKRRLVAARTETLGLDNYQRDRQLITDLYRTIPFRHEFPRVIGQIMDSMTLRDALPGPITYKPATTPLEGLVAYTMNCSATGNYPGLKRLIVDLERMGGIATLDTVSFAGNDAAPNQVTLTLHLTVYLREGHL